MSDTKLFSIITVVKDDPEGFAASLNSLEEQTHRDFEFVVIDSSRDPAAVTQMLEDSGLNGDISIRYQWCTPNGIYPAMNLGLEMQPGSLPTFSMPVTGCTPLAS